MAWKTGPCRLWRAGLRPAAAWLPLRCAKAGCKCLMQRGGSIPARPGSVGDGLLRGSVLELPSSAKAEAWTPRPPARSLLFELA